MARLDFNSRIKKDQYQVFLFSSPASFPFQYARHGWFVINKKGTVSRWEVLMSPVHRGTHWGNIYKDFSEPFVGVTIFPYARGFYWSNVHLLGSIEGGENSVAHMMGDFIERSPIEYSYKDIYRFLGPNSNTYVAWVLNKFPEFKHENLNWRYVGKNFKQ